MRPHDARITVSSILFLLVLCLVTSGCASTDDGATGGPPEGDFDYSMSRPSPPSPFWPLPPPSARTVLPAGALGSDSKTLGDVWARLRSAIDRSGYPAQAVHPVPGGFAIATRIERIDADGRPMPPPARWSAAIPIGTVHSLGDYIRAMFQAPEGHYRVIVFIVNDRANAPGAGVATQGLAASWIDSGADGLAPALKKQRLSPQHRVTA